MFITTGKGPLLLGIRISPNWLGSVPYGICASAGGGGRVRMSSEGIGNSVAERNSLSRQWGSSVTETEAHRFYCLFGPVSRLAGAPLLTGLPSSRNPIKRRSLPCLHVLSSLFRNSKRKTNS